jgi:hypothetical protein
MSTDIVHFNDGGNGVVQKFAPKGALQLYFAVTIPLMGLTFLAWGTLQIWEKKKMQKWLQNREGIV